MRDLLPAEQALRDYIQGEILATYRAAGFQRISTPILEDLENLNKSDGGDNLNLIFKVLKRGEKLSAALRANDPEALADMGLRYDLTLPLSRYYAANRAALPHPFKVIQTDRVYRAERPQKGRPARICTVRHRYFGRREPERRGRTHRRDRPRAAAHRLHRFHRAYQRPAHPARDARRDGLRAGYPRLGLHQL